MSALKGKIALVTGASRGIGEAIARRFAREGASVVLAARNADRCSAIAREIGLAGGNALAVACDVSQPAAVSGAVSRALERHPRIDILVNNAGRSGLTPAQGESDEEVFAAWSAILEANLTGAFRMVRAVAPRMPDGGRIVNMSSVVGRFGVPGYAAYSASKHGVIGLTRTLALELAPRRITVNAICPGWVETEMGRMGFERLGRARSKDMEAGRAAAARMAPLGRVLDPEEIAGLAAYIVSEEARDLTGQAIVLDGGQVMP